MVIVGLTLATLLDQKRGILPWGNNTVGYEHIHIRGAA